MHSPHSKSNEARPSDIKLYPSTPLPPYSSIILLTEVRCFLTIKIAIAISSRALHCSSICSILQWIESQRIFKNKSTLLIFQLEVKNDDMLSNAQVLFVRNFSALKLWTNLSHFPWRRLEARFMNLSQG